jgi:hypothetical protein
MRRRPLCRNNGGDARSAELAARIDAHQKAISAHQRALLADISEFNRTEAWRGDGAFSMATWLTSRLRISSANARTLVAAAAKVDELPRLADALSEGRVTLDVFAPIAAVAKRHNDADLAEAAEHWTPKQARELRGSVEGPSDDDAARSFVQR